MNLIETITNDFCETFATKEDCNGFMSRTIAVCGDMPNGKGLPEGVDFNDYRVKQIIK